MKTEVGAFRWHHILANHKTCIATFNFVCIGATAHVFVEIFLDNFVWKFQKISQLVLVEIMREAEDEVIEVFFTFCLVV